MNVMTKFEIDRQLRSRIITQEYAPGSRLPTRVKLEEEFGVSSNTVQRALDRLIKDGFVVAKGRQGTFTAENPPHLSKIALVFNGSTEYLMGHSHFYRSLINELKSIEKRKDVSFEIIENITSWRSTDAIEQLVDDVLEKRLAGLIFPTVPFSLKNTPILDHPDIARVGIMSSTSFGMPAVWHDDHSFFSNALDQLERDACKRPAFLVNEGIFTESQAFLLNNARDRQISVEFKWIQPFGLNYKDGIDNQLELLFDSEHPNRPDSLVVGDDTILERVSTKLKMMGINGIDDVKLVALANFPWPGNSCLPVVNIGYETNKTLDICVELIKKQLNGEIVDELTTLPAVYEHEI